LEFNRIAVVKVLMAICRIIAVSALSISVSDSKTIVKTGN
jgi:hypothetical protein